MKVLFLDIDGVLNSHKYDLTRMPDEGNIDETRLPLLFEIIVRTDAKIVLSSSWREHHWSKEADMSDAVGWELDELFGRYGLEIFDKTPVLPNNDRSEEIKRWLADHEAEHFVILDDLRFGWGDLDPFVVKTSYRIGRGLEQKHVDAAIKLLNG